jgi:hypothetical protein
MSVDIVLGEGLSRISYQRPKTTDTAVLIGFYNFAHYKRSFYNTLYVIERLMAAKIPVFVAECVFGADRGSIPGADLVLRTDSMMFFKEQLWNALEKIVPEEFTKLIFLDSDILVGEPAWIDAVSRALNEKDVLQPFSEAVWLSPDNRREVRRAPSYFAVGVKSVRRIKLGKHHPGFAVAIRRDVFRAMGGFYDRAFLGSGDVFFMAALFRKDIEYCIKDVRRNPEVLDGFHMYLERVRSLRLRLGVTPFEARHLFHGLVKSRQYGSRYKMLRGKDSRVVRDAETGLWQWVAARSINPEVRKFFETRNEDIPLEEAMAVVNAKESF